MWIHGHLILLMSVTVILFVAGCGESTNSTKPLDRLSKVSPFVLSESNGYQISDTNLLGKIWVAHFFYSRCGKECTILGKRMESIQTMNASNPDVRLVSFSVDPEGDTPRHLQYYAKEFNADTNRWYFVTGEKTGLYNLIIDSFLLPASTEVDSRSDFPKNFIHSEKFAVVDRHGFVRAFFDGMDRTTPERVTETIARLTTEVLTGK